MDSEIEKQHKELAIKEIIETMQKLLEDNLEEARRSSRHEVRQSKDKLTYEIWERVATISVKRSRAYDSYDLWNEDMRKLFDKIVTGSPLGCEVRIE